MKDHLVRILTEDGTLRAMAAVTTNLVEEIRVRQGTDPNATVALGRLATGTPQVFCRSCRTPVIGRRAQRLEVRFCDGGRGTLRGLDRLARTLGRLGAARE